MATSQTPSSPSEVYDEGLKRDVGIFGLLWASEGSIIGSGWLFGALYATTIAGPGSLIAWVIASFIIILLALVHAELGGIFPVSGGTSRYPHFAFGTFAGATFGWFSYIQAATVAPIEVLATIQYMSTVSWAHGWYNASTNTLSGPGVAVAVGLMVFFTLLNLIGVRWLARANSGITTWKVLIPILAIVVLLLTHFHASNFTAGGGFFYAGSGGVAKNILIAIPAAGIVFALLGFEQAVQLGGESAHPQRDLPRAVIGSIVIGAVIYILVQFAFVGALDLSTIPHFHTWPDLANNAALSASPYYTLAKVAGLVWLAWILRLDAVVSPAGTGLIYLTSTSRISFGLSKNGYIPALFEKSSQRTKIPVFGVIFSTAVGLLFLLPFPSWSKLVTVVTSSSVLMYAGAPLALGALRKSKPDLPRSYRLPVDKILAPLSFVLATYIVYWSGWETYTAMMLALIIGYVIMTVSFVFKLNPATPKLDWKSARWLLPYLTGLGVVSYFGGFGPGGIFGGIGVFKNVLVGGQGGLPLGYDLLVLGAFSLAIYFAAMTTRLPADQVDGYLHEMFASGAATEELH
ncbi:MAG: APC family permease [Acidimicrobiales bacterium]|jgi:amino acid transporter